MAIAGIGLLLKVIGIFSVMGYTVALRTHEIGVRMALSARPTNILVLVLLKGFRLLVTGTTIGILMGYSLTRFLASEISGISLTDPWTFAAVAALVPPTLCRS
jgi:ABC-type antimicrobial peptide transport system permease subunit